MMNNFFKRYLGMVIFFIIPLIILVVSGFFIIQTSKQYLKEVVNFILLITISFSVVSIFGIPILRKGLMIFSVVLLHILLFIKLSFYYTYGSKLNGSAFYLIFETNGQESLGFLANYFNGFVTLLALILIISLALFFMAWHKDKIGFDNFFKFKSEVLKLFFFSVLITISIYIINTRLDRQNIFIASSLAYKEYIETKSMIKKDLSKPNSDYLEILNTSKDSQTHVVIIGETIAKGHMSLYSYMRETNPELDKIKNELFIFNDVISPNNQTMKSLDKILTFSDYNNPYKNMNSSIIQLANAAKFETYWISNQQAIGKYESVATQIGYAANNKYFLSNDDFMSVSYDEILLDKLNEVLKEAKDRKVIFIHLMGGHTPYYIRYPESFDYFQDLVLDKDLSKSQKRKINYYDNAIRYNDYIVTSIIKKVKSMGVKSSVLFFSDHGEDVYDSDKKSLLGHNEYKYSNEMYEIPFLLWLSEDFRKKNWMNDFHNYLGRKYNLEDFFHSFSELIDVNHNLFEPKKSIFNKNFIEKERIIQNGVNYDNFKFSESN